MGSQDMSKYARSAEFDDELFDRVLSVVELGKEIPTLSNNRPNRIVSVGRCGVSLRPYVRTVWGPDRRLFPRG